MAVVAASTGGAALLIVLVIVIVTLAALLLKAKSKRVTESANHTGKMLLLSTTFGLYHDFHILMG